MHIAHTIPKRIRDIGHSIQQAGGEAFIVGGCVRDLVLGKQPHDWDITTNLHPQAILRIFTDTKFRAVYENAFGTVGLVSEDLDPSHPEHTIEITTYRADGPYRDGRHPEEVTFSDTLEDDLIRRDFTVNALAYSITGDIETNILVDKHGGLRDLADGIIRAVGDPEQRFTEDALRIMRMVRFASVLDFRIEPKTFTAGQKHAQQVSKISKERIRDELTKIILSAHPKKGIELLRETHLLPYTLPYLADGVGVDQSRSHIYDVWTHNLLALQHAADAEYPLHIRMSALLHDVGKPKTRRRDHQKNIFTFFGHEVVGAKMTKEMLRNLVYPKQFVALVTNLVRYHMFFSDPDAITLSAVRRMIRNVGKEHIWDLMHLRRCDRKGMGRPKAAPYRLRKYEAMIDQALMDPISVGMLKLNGDIMIGEMGMKPGRRMGWILHALLEEVLDDPKKNTREYLEERAHELDQLDDATLEKMGRAGKEEKDKREEQEIKKIEKKHNV